MEHRIVPPHPDPWIDLTRGYVSRVAHALSTSGSDVRESWLDPRDPRDATIVFVQEGRRRALVWDEERGWRVGDFVAGEQGVRTMLVNEIFLGDRVLPAPELVVDAALRGEGRPEATVYRHHTHALGEFTADLAAYPVPEPDRTG